MLTFIVPVIAEEICDDWGRVLANLGKTLASVRNQTDRNWRVLIVSQSRPAVDYIDDRIVFVPADFPPARRYPADARLSPVKRAVCRRANDLDRVRKIRVAAQTLHRYRTDHVMLLEADDLVSNRLCQFVNEYKQANGWSIDKGYVWDGRSRYLFRTDRLTTLSGSSWVARVFYDMLPTEIPIDVDPATLSLVPSGCPFLDHGHRKMRTGMADAGRPLDMLPFRGVIYHWGHGANLSRQPDSNRLPFIKRLRHWQRRALTAPQRTSERILMTDRLRSEFAIQAPGDSLRDGNGNAPIPLTR